ncbi:diaminopimelate epimerase [Olleya aquimaris]|uniref:Diaminopimelate epimerase n=1 Tax=Olleya aquimaris TaxID=639310 RepID=A0A327RNG4_9FLAO|nr:diaminopimelate epimerase [Olleya aquimaris]RAJ17093.1 diaminopimelate epimerase [Olleya aquimaris]
MTLTFYKYQGTGNDFVIVDNRQHIFNKNNTKLIAFLCDRKFGIGADGLILLENHPEHDFKMVYFNADGNESTMCGNGGRCIVAFAEFLQLIKYETTFEAIDGLHYAKIENGLIHLQMKEVDTIQIFDTHQFLDTGSPHHVQLVDDLATFDVKNQGRTIRYGQPYKEAGTNVNFVKQIDQNTFAVRTYERGVEDETLSCGTGVTAVAIAMHKTGQTNASEINLNVEGGQLKVAFSKEEDTYKNVMLIGPATQVFKGEITC